MFTYTYHSIGYQITATTHKQDGISFAAPPMIHAENKNLDAENITNLKAH